MATLKGLCPACGTEIDMTVGQAVFDGKLVWNRGCSCPGCGDRVEEDEWGLPPDDVRMAILRQEGEWALNLYTGKTEREMVVALKLLRQALNLSLHEVGELRALVPALLAMGTKTEMKRLSSILAVEGVRSSVYRTQQ